MADMTVAACSVVVTWVEAPEAVGLWVVEASVDGEGALGALKALATVAALVEEEGWQARVVEKANNPTIVGKHRQSGTQRPIRGIVTRCR